MTIADTTGSDRITATHRIRGGSGSPRHDRARSRRRPKRAVRRRITGRGDGGGAVMGQMVDGGRHRRNQPAATRPRTRTRTRRGAGVASRLADTVHALRLDYPDGTHEFVGRDRDQRQSRLRLAGLNRGFRSLPWRPRLSMVVMSDDAFARHARGRLDCTEPGCPAADMPAVPA